VGSSANSVRRSALALVMTAATASRRLGGLGRGLRCRGGPSRRPGGGLGRRARVLGGAGGFLGRGLRLLGRLLPRHGRGLNLASVHVHLASGQRNARVGSQFRTLGRCRPPPCPRFEVTGGNGGPLAEFDEGTASG
jgi:hypothetical protein